ncbi:peroxidasin homolog [Mytilus galloprovincialis]|uniref:peroxidasin homolog n=1 Tax=Mytilus galloprovincialis TaxID=29158 RepID=UPI003F7C4206
MGTSKGHIVIIINYGPNQVILSPNRTSYTFDENSDVPDITCTADCQPDCTLTWIKQTGQVISTEILSLKETQRNQAGTYQCNASNDFGNMVSTDVTISVRYGAEIKGLTIDGENFTIPEHVETRLACEIDGIPKPNGRLFYNDEEKQSSGNPITYGLVPLCNDTGNYTCAAENSIGKSNQTKELFVLCSPRPVATLQSRIAVGNDSILEINVIFLSYPQPKISWTFIKNGSNEIVRSNNTIGIYQHVSSIYITDMKTPQYGMYVLKVTNGIQNDLKHTFEVLPQHSPTILRLEILNGNTVDERQSVDFLCEVNGYPVPDISWILSSTNTVLKKDEHVFKSNYLIPKANCLHTGSYRCQGINVIDGELVNAFSEIDLFVLCSARIDQRYQEELEDIAVMENGDLNIRVYILAYPEPIIIWTMRHSVTGQDYTVNYTNSFNNVEHISTVNITEVSTKDYGVYTIIAYNKIGPPYVKSFTVKPQGSNNRSENNLFKSIGASVGAFFFILIVAGLTIIVLKTMKRRANIKRDLFWYD